MIDTISTWDDLVEQFVQKFYNLSDHHKDEGTSDENNPNIIDNVPEIFKIEEDVFNFDTPLCIAFKEFNYLLKIDPSLFTYDIQGIKTYDEYEQELNNEKHKGLMNNGQRMGFHINLVTTYANYDNASAERLDHMDHICEEVSSLHLKLGDKESFIIHQVSAKIKSSLPVLVTTALQEQLSGLLSATLKDYLPSILQESLQTHIPAVFERLADKQTKLNKKVVRHLNRQFNIFHVAESDRFARLETELSKTHKSDMGKSITSLVKSGMKEVNDDLNSETKSLGKFWEHQSAKTLVESQGEQPADVKVANKESAPLASNKPSEGKELVVHNSEKKKSEGIILVEDDSDEDDKQPLSKRFKILTPIPDIPNPTPLNTFVPEHLLKSKEQQKSIQEFTDQLFKTTASRKLLNPATLKAQAQKWTKHKAKKAKMMEEYNHQISYGADPLPITKISYVVNSRKEATMKITRGNNPLNLIVHPNFRLKTLGFSEWLEAKRLRLPPPLKHATFGLTTKEKKGKRTELIIGEPLSSGLRGEEDQLSAKHKLAVKGLSECKALESNMRLIQVKDIVKEVEDYLKTYSSARMDISMFVEGIR
ncbi:hypothetical protein Tco_1188766 [Tanacetum coccineum]